MNLAQPFWLTALAVLPVLFLLAAWSIHSRHRLYASVFNGEVLARILPRGLVYRRWTGLIMALLGLGMVLLGLAEPRFGKQVREVERKGVDVVVAVDLSRSMNAVDVEPSRLGRAQRELYDLADMMDGDRIGLVIYAGGAYGRMPLTLDYDAFELLVRELDTRTFTRQGSDLASAIRESMRLLGDDQGAGRAILVLSDGEVHDASEALAAAGEAKDAAIRIYALGIGEEPSPIPLGDGRNLTWKGDTVMSDPDPAVLRDVARITGGAYVDSAASTDDMQRLYATGIRRTLEARSTGTIQKETWRSAFQIPLLAGFFLIALGVIAGESRRVALIGVALLIALPARAASVLDGDEAYREGRFSEAVEVFTELALEQPGDSGLWHRLGAARYRAKDFEGSARAYDRASEISGDLEDVFASGNAHYNAGRLDEALERYDAVLDADPGHAGASRNKAILVRELEARILKEPPPPPKPEPENSEGQEDQGEKGESGEQAEDGEQEGQGEESQGAGQGTEGSEQDGGSESETEQGEGSGEPESGEEGTGSAESDGSDRTGEQGPDEPGEGEEEGLESLEALEGEGDGEGEDALAHGQGESTGAGESDGPMTEAQAERLLESVEEGRPRVSIPGGRSERPW